jgi:hypothetical protein
MAAAPSLLALVPIPTAREHLPALADTFEDLTPWQRHLVMAKRPHEYFAPYVPDLLAAARGFRTAEAVTSAAVIPHGPFLSVALLRDALAAWSGNNQCREAGSMPDFAVALYRSTTQLRHDDEEVWRQFLVDVRAKLRGDPTTSEYDSWYSYNELEAALDAGGPTAARGATGR